MSGSVTSADEEREFQRSWRPLPRFVQSPLFDELIANEFTDPELLQRQQAERLKVLLRYAAECIPYYQSLFRAHSSRPEQLDSSEDLCRLPVLTRFDLLNSFDELHPRDLRPFENQLHLAKTTGSSGLPVKVIQTRHAKSMFHVLWQRQARWFRLDLAKRFARIRVPADLFRLPGGELNPEGHGASRASWMHSGLFFETGDEVHFNVGNPRPAQLEWLRHHVPAYLLSFPGLLEELALANDCTPLPGLESLVAISSMLTASMRKRIEASFEVPIHQNYGLNEVGIVAIRCAAGRYHVNHEHAHVEIVDQEGQPVSSGHVGRLLVTSMNNEAMPLIRYDTGDMATAEAGACACGRTSPSFRDILGRYIRFAGTPEGTRPRLNGLLAVLSDMPNPLFHNIRQYQIHQNADKGFEMRVVACGPLDERFGQVLSAAWRGLNADGEQWCFGLVEVEAIEATPSGKQLDFVSAFHVLDEDFE